MEIKRVMKRLFAVGTGVFMLGATAMGALAADLGSYPSMFVKDGSFNGYVVVGENSKAIDNLAAIDIATSMKYMKAGESATTTVEGDAWRVGTSADWLEINESIGPSSTGIVDYIDDSELEALAPGTFSNSKGSFPYDQKLHFDTEGPKAWFMEDDDENVGVFWKITSGNRIARYELDFTTQAESDIDASDSYSLKDFEDKTMSFMGTDWTITTAKYTLGSGGTVALTFMAGSSSGTLLETETSTFSVNDVDYEVSLTFVDADEAAFTVNGQSTGKLEDGETFTMADGNEIGVSDILYQNYAGGVHQASFFIGANKLYMTDNISDALDSDSEVKVNEETIEGALPRIVGSITTEPVSTTTDGALKLDYLWINMTAQDDIYLQDGNKLSEDSELIEKELLFTNNWDFEYMGVDESVGTSLIKLQRAGDDKYELKFTSNDGNEVTLPLMYATGTPDQFALGKKSGDNLAMNVSVNITDDDYFVVASKDTTSPTNSDAIVTVLQYASSKKNSSTATRTVKFKNVNTGEFVETNFDGDDCTFDLAIEGRTHQFGSASTSDCNSANWDIKLTSDDFAYDATSDENASRLVLRDESGSLITVTTQAAEALTDDPGQLYTNNGTLDLAVSADDTDRDDDYLTVSSAETQFSATLDYSATNEVQATVTGPQWTVADTEDTDVTHGLSAWGSVYKKTAPSSTPVEVELMVPTESSQKVVAYVTSGATASSVSAGGTLTAVEVVDATKLDNEVADATAQNLIVVGGPCVNSVAAELLGNPADCTEGFTAGKARIKLFTNGDNMAMLVAGWNGEDTRLAGKVVAHRYSEMSGDEIVVEGTTYSDATISAPTEVVVEEVMEEEVMEEEVVADEVVADAE